MGLQREGAYERGGLLTNDEVINDSVSVILPHILQNENAILRFKYTTSTHFLSQTISKSRRRRDYLDFFLIREEFSRCLY